jgi:hypothetical protein
MPDEFQLTLEEKEIETVLRSLRPAPARLKLAAEPVDGAPARRAPFPRLRSWHVAAAAAIAFVLAAWLVVHRRGELSDQLKRHWAVIEKKFIDPQTQQPVQPVQPPTLLAYRMALAQSAGHFDALLARQASAASASQGQSSPATVLTPWNADLYPSRGEL